MGSMMEYNGYNGYHAKVEFDDKDNIFVGTVIGLNDMIAFHGSSVDELTMSFKNSIDNYLNWCTEAGKKPEREFKGVFNVRSAGMLFWIKTLDRSDGRSEHNRV